MESKIHIIVRYDDDALLTENSIRIETFKKELEEKGLGRVTIPGVIIYDDKDELEILKLKEKHGLTEGVKFVKCD